MSLAEIENRILALPPEELRQFRAWLYAHEADILAPDSLPLTPAQLEELRRRKQEYLDHPERFTRVGNEQQLNDYFDGIRSEVRARFSPAR